MDAANVEKKEPGRSRKVVKVVGKTDGTNFMRFWKEYLLEGKDIRTLQ